LAGTCFKLAAHLGSAAVVATLTKKLTNGDAVDADVEDAFARVAANLVEALSYTQLLLDVALDDAGWNSWNKVRCLANHNKALLVALRFTQDASIPDHEIVRWMAEPVKLVIIPHDVFLFNKKNYPVLSKKHQQWVHRLMDLNSSIQFVVTAPSRSPVSEENGGLSAYKIYLDHLYKIRPEPGVVDKFAAGYDDYLQAPLQPLMDHLESATYEVFEKDPVKYQQYELAIKAYLTDRLPRQKDFHICVFGAGRGPLVDCALRASSAVPGSNVKITALEKNPNAIVILETKKQERWGPQVSIVFADMRFYTPTEQADLLVSELLGSFGDNELSPECLDGAQRVLKPDGVSIPHSYTAFISPISSTKLWTSVASYNDVKHLETPYVVKLKAIAAVGGDPVPLWTFTHPLPGVNVT
ncbi:Protein arginine N-methyltransferase 5, partial [Rhizoclosmatium hyalinum]